jgi:hypothetical protein
MSGTNKVAILLDISFKDAGAYCHQVRVLSGMGPALHYKTIAQYLAHYIAELPSPQQLAEIIQTRKTPELLIKKVPIKQTRQDLPIDSLSLRSKGRKKQRRVPFAALTKPNSILNQPDRNPSYDKERVSEERLVHCPHGVPHGRVCAICDPEKFREMTGMD